MLRPEQFALEIGCDRERLDRLYDNVDASYREWETTKPGGGTRKIAAPKGFLNSLLRRIQRRYLKGRTWLPCVHGVEGRGQLENASAHLGKKHHFITDIYDFFPSVDPDKVYWAFVKGLGFSHKAARYARRLTTRNGGLPQGAYTSSRIADLVLYKMDRQLSQFCQEHGITYTRYADDLSFSSQEDFEVLIPQLKQIIRDADFMPHRDKTAYKVGSVEVTGVIVENNRLRAPERIYQRLDELRPDSESYLGVLSYIERIEQLESA